MTDIIIIAASKNKELINMTQNAVDSCYMSKGSFNIVVVETFKKHKYKNAKVIECIRKKFNYNRTINFALGKTKNSIVGVFNNDVIFHKDWFIELEKGFSEFESLSPRCEKSNIKTNGIIEGYKLRKHLNGWAIVFKRSILDKIGKLNDKVEFWRSDDAFAQQLKINSIRHALVSNSVVNHIDSKTLKTLDQKEKKKFTYDQFHTYKDLDLHNYTFTVVMPSYLGEYKEAAENREMKLRRAIQSVINQTFKDWELIIISDGCDKTSEIAQEYISDKIKCYQIPKQPYMSGNVRQIGLEYATGKYIIYLDSDDMYSKNHLEFVISNMNGQDWVYFNDIRYNGEDEYSVKDVYLDYGTAGTSSICHKRLLNETWEKCNGYGHDWTFIEKLKQHTNYKHIGTSGYLICHVPGKYDYNGN
jgi:glycosyltransferase involved in cell wall biosynthesis